MAEDGSHDINELTATIVANYVAHNKVEGGKLAEIIGDVHKALTSAGQPAPKEPETAKLDKAAIKKSIHPDYLTSLIDGRSYKSLKRHLGMQGLSPHDYRERFGLPKDYPMVAANYSAARSEMARSLGLGRKAKAAEALQPVRPPAKRARKAEKA